MLITVEHELNLLRRQFSQLSEYVKDKAIPQTINQVGSLAFTRATKLMKEYTGIPKKNLVYGSDGVNPRPIMKKKQGNQISPWFEINVKSRWLHVSEPYFNPRQTRKGVSSKYYSIRKVHKGSFFGKGKNSGKIIAFVRTKKQKDVRGATKILKRAIVKPVWAFNPANEFMKERIADHIIETYTPIIIERYHRKLSQYMANKAKK